MPIHYLTSNHQVAYTMCMDKDIVFKALADPTRRLILDEFNERPEQTLYELMARLTMKHAISMSRQAIAKHVDFLQGADLLRSEHRGKYRVLILNHKLGDKPILQPIKVNQATGMKIIATSIFVDDQAEALKFYTEKLGFVKKHDTPMGEFRWLALVSPHDQNGTELILEPADDSVTRAYKKGLFEQGIPVVMFGVHNIEDEYQRLKTLGVTFAMQPTRMDQIKVAVFDDTCGNFIQILERREGGNTM